MRLTKKNPVSGNLEKENRSIKEKASNHGDQINKSRKKFVGVTKRKSGKYGVKVHDRLRKKDVWLGTFDTPEEASKVYLAKKKELEQSLLPRIARVSKRTSRFVGVSMRDSGKFAAHIRDPIRKKKLYLGAFETEEEAAEVYLGKKAELEEEAKGKGIRWMSKRECRKSLSELRSKVDDLDRCIQRNSSDTMDIDDSQVPEENSPILEDNNSDPGLEDNHESSEENDNSDSSNVESGSRDEVPEENSSISEENNDDPGLEDNQESSKENDNSDSSNVESGSRDAVPEENLPISEENHDDPCLDNQEFSNEVDNSVSSHKEIASKDSGVSKENLLIHKNEGSPQEELVVVDSSVQSMDNPDAKILVRTNSGTPVMDSNGFLLGKWSWIDDLSLSIIV